MVADTSRRQEGRHDASIDGEVLLFAEVIHPSQSVAPSILTDTLAELVLCDYLETRGELKVLISSSKSS